MTRRYEMKEREKRQEETRLKIVEAAIRLHQKQGIAATSMSDIAGEAGVGKVTVYRHFPDIEAMTGACSGLYFERHPPPDPGPWLEIQDPRERMKQGLCDLYLWYAQTEPMMSSVYWEVRDTPLMAPYHAHLKLLAETLDAAWERKEDEGAAKRRLAAIVLALDFDTWRTLVRAQGLDLDQATELMLRLVTAQA